MYSKKNNFFEMSNNDVVRNEHDIMFSIKMLNFEFFEFLNEIACRFKKFDNDEFENDKNKRKNKKYVT